MEESESRHRGRAELQSYGRGDCVEPSGETSRKAHNDPGGQRAGVRVQGSGSVGRCQRGHGPPVLLHAKDPQDTFAVVGEIAV